MIIALDTETTGLDIPHGARPFLVTICFEDARQKFWEWKVNPFDRSVTIPPEDIDEIREIVDSASVVVCQNGKFDVAMLKAAGVVDRWDWSKMEDTLFAGHLLASNQKHNLTDMVSMYLGKNIQPYEDRLEDACKEARRICRTRYKRWRIAKYLDPMMPSLKKSTKKIDEKGWKFDSWLPRTLAIALKYPASHPWYTVLSKYANIDSAMTLALWNMYMRGEIKRQDQWEIHQARMKLPEVYHDMEQRGVTINKARLLEVRDKYKEESALRGRVCVNIAKEHDYDLNLPKNSNNNSLLHFCFGVPIKGQFDRHGRPIKRQVLNLPVVEETDKGNPSLDKEAIATYQNTLEPGSLQSTFITNLVEKRGYDTALGFCESYQRFWTPLHVEGCEGKGYEIPDWFVMHPSQNPTGTDTLRGSCSNPNSQQISKKEKANLRYAFGPAPGREWWSLDAQNIELRIPAFEANEELLMDVFNRPKDPPYYGSYHLVVFDVLHPELFAEHGKDCKDLFEDTWYQWVKNGNFAVIYGAQEAKADQTYHVKGAFKKIRDRFPGIAKLNDRMKAIANRQGYVETIPDKTVNPNRGYKLFCARTDSGMVMPTVPLNYHIQSTACWWKQKGLVRCHNQLKEWRASTGFDGYIIMDVHDELVFDFPKSSQHPSKDFEKEKEGKTHFRTSNLWRTRIMQRLMEQGGDDIGINTPVGCEFNEHTWKDMVKF